jgi:hypothetical protein
LDDAEAGSLQASPLDEHALDGVEGRHKVWDEFRLAAVVAPGSDVIGRRADDNMLNLADLCAVPARDCGEARTRETRAEADLTEAVRKALPRLLNARRL